MTAPEQCAACNAVGWHVGNCPIPAAEARGRAEVAAKVRELAKVLNLTADGHREHQRDRQLRNGIAVGYDASADRLRALAAEVAPPEQR